MPPAFHRGASRTRLADEMATPAGGTKAVEAAADAGKATADTIGASSALADGTITVAADGAEGAAKKHKKKHKHKHSKDGKQDKEHKKHKKHKHKHKDHGEAAQSGAAQPAAATPAVVPPPAAAPPAAAASLRHPAEQPADASRSRRAEPGSSEQPPERGRSGPAWHERDRAPLRDRGYSPGRYRGRSPPPYRGRSPPPRGYSPGRYRRSPPPYRRSPPPYRRSPPYRGDYYDRDRRSPYRGRSRSRSRSRSYRRSRSRSRGRSRGRSFNRESPVRRSRAAAQPPAEGVAPRAAANSTNPASAILGRFWDGFQWVDTDPRGGDRTTAGSQQTTRKDRRVYVGNLPMGGQLTEKQLSECITAAMAQQEGTAVPLPAGTAAAGTAAAGTVAAGTAAAGTAAAGTAAHTRCSPRSRCQ